MTADLSLDAPQEVIVNAPDKKPNQQTLLQVELATRGFVPGTNIVVTSGDDKQPVATISPFGVGTAPHVTKYTLTVPESLNRVAAGKDIKLKFELEASQGASTASLSGMEVEVLSVVPKSVDAE